MWILWLKIHFTAFSGGENWQGFYEGEGGSVDTMVGVKWEANRKDGGYVLLSFSVIDRQRFYSDDSSDFGRKDVSDGAQGCFVDEG